MHDVPHGPWQTVAIDVFTIRGRNYLVTVDYYSNFCEVDYLENPNSTTLIHKLKHHFARYGIPLKLVSDGGPQMTSTEFKQFAKKWEFEHQVVSPGNSKANGLAESQVKIMKRLMKKCNDDNQDPYLAILNQRNIPTENVNSSPAQRMFNRQTNTLLPMIGSKLQQTPKQVEEREKLVNKRKQFAKRFTHRKPLKELSVGDKVMMQPTQFHEKTGRAAIVSKKLQNREYEVQTRDGRVYRRNRVLIRR